MDQNETKHGVEAPFLVLISSSENCVGQNEVRLNRKWCLPVKDDEITELKKQMKLAGPLVVVSFLQYSLPMISLMFIGHLGELSLSGATMAASFAGVTGFTLILGVGSTLETLCGQSYGAKQYHMLGVYMQRAVLVISLLCIPISIIWANTTQIFTFLKQDPQISEEAGIYAFWLIPSILPYGLLQCQFRFLQTQNDISPLLISTLVTSLLHVPVCWIMILKLGFENKGAALSSAISFWFNVLVLGMYIKLSPTCQKTWTGFSKEGIKNLLGFCKLAIPSAVMVCAECWSYEFLVLMSGLLPNPKLETSMMSISQSTSALVFRIPFGFGSAVSTRVSNELGAGRPYAARLAARIVVFLAITQSLLLSLIAIAVRRVWGYLFTNEEEVVRYLAIIMPVLAISNFMDGIQAALSGIARGCGWQKIGAYVNFGAYYLVGLPCAIILTFAFHFGGKGLWMGIICGSSLQAFLFLIVSLSTNWEEEAKKAKDRLYNSSISDC